MYLKLFTFFFLSSCLIDAKYYRTSVIDFSKCKTYISPQNYEDFFNITEENRNGKLFDFHFSVQGPKDAHILLAPSQNVTKSDRVYEIVLGANDNTRSDIRKKQKKDFAVSNSINNLLSAEEIRSFWVHISKDGTIDVGKEGELWGFMSWTDPDPLSLEVFSFSSYTKASLKWFFDCVRGDWTVKRPQVISRNVTFPFVAVGITVILILISALIYYVLRNNIF